MSTDARRKYGERALQGQLEKLHAAGAGGRNNALFRFCASLGRLVDGGAIAASEIEAHATAWAESSGLMREGRRQALSTIRSGIARGMASPKTDWDAPRGALGRGPAQAARPLGAPAPMPPPVSSSQSPQPPPLPPDEGLPPTTTPPPRGELREFWQWCEAVTEVDDVCAWMRARRRKLNPELVADLDLARVARPSRSRPWPRWTGPRPKKGKRWKPWPLHGLSLVIPLYDHTGAMRSVLFRRAFESQAAWPPKSVGALGPRRGLVMACPTARWLLRTQQWDIDLGPDLGHHARPSARKEIVIAEGECDYLAAACDGGEIDEWPPAVFGLTSGSWTAALAAHIPEPATFSVATDHDHAGEQYARKVRSMSKPGHTVRRGRPLCHG